MKEVEGGLQEEDDYSYDGVSALTPAAGRGASDWTIEEVWAMFPPNQRYRAGVYILESADIRFKPDSLVVIYALVYKAKTLIRT